MAMCMCQLQSGSRFYRHLWPTVLTRRWRLLTGKLVQLVCIHNDDVTWTCFPYYWPFVRRIRGWSSLTKARKTKLWWVFFVDNSKTIDDDLHVKRPGSNYIRYHLYWKHMWTTWLGLYNAVNIVGKWLLYHCPISESGYQVYPFWKTVYFYEQSAKRVFFMWHNLFYNHSTQW